MSKTKTSGPDGFFQKPYANYLCQLKTFSYNIMNKYFKQKSAEVEKRSSEAYSLK